jgi:hypothetical protein
LSVTSHVVWIPAKVRFAADDKSSMGDFAIFLLTTDAISMGYAP